MKLWIKFILFSSISLALILTIYVPGKQKVWYEDQVAVLMYHHVHDVDQSPNTVTPQLLEQQLSYLHRNGHRFISLKEFDSFMEGGQVPANAVLVTFDDGYQSFYTHASPVLKKLQIPSVNYIITDKLENPVVPGQTPYISRDEIKQLSIDTDLMDFQCHTDALHYKPDGKALLANQIKIGQNLESEGQYHQRVLQDTEKCISKLQEIHSNTVYSFAYPYGIYNKDIIPMLQQAGIKYAFTVVSGMAGRESSPMLIPRINAGNPKISPEELQGQILKRIIRP